jgi:hypothetical protein
MVFERAKQTCHTADRVSPSERNRVALSFAEFVGHLEQELELQLGVTGKRVFQDHERHPKQRDIGHGLNRVHVQAVFSETEDVFSEMERQHWPFPAWQIAKCLHDAMAYDVDRFGRCVLAVDNGPPRQVQAGRDGGEFLLLSNGE